MTVAGDAGWGVAAAAAQGMDPGEEAGTASTTDRW